MNRAHVAADLLPYSCIDENCDTSEEMYLNSRDLLAHMLEKHSETRWTCDYCTYDVESCSPDEGDGSQAPEKIRPHFASAEDWKSHVTAEHGDRVPGDQRDLVAELNKRQLIKAYPCPLCNQINDEINGTSLQSEINSHTLTHLHEFALRSLPDVADEGDDQDGDQSSNASRVPGPALSHTSLTDEDKAIARDYATTGAEEVKDGTLYKIVESLLSQGRGIVGRNENNLEAHWRAQVQRPGLLEDFESISLFTPPSTASIMETLNSTAMAWARVERGMRSAIIFHSNPNSFT